MLLHKDLLKKENFLDVFQTNVFKENNYHIFDILITFECVNIRIGKIYLNN